MRWRSALIDIKFYNELNDRCLHTILYKLKNKEQIKWIFAMYKTGK